MQRTIRIAAACVAVALVSCGKKPGALPGRSRPASATAASAAATAPWDAQALARLADLEAQGRRAVADQDLGRLVTIPDALKALRFRSQEDVRRRDALAGEFAAQAAKLRDAVHRFLFVELKPLPFKRRQAALDAADRGEGDPISDPARALAEHLFAAGRRHLRAAPGLPPGRKDPATGLTVRRAGDLHMPFHRRFIEAFNARVRQLLAATRPAH